MQDDKLEEVKCVIPDRCYSSMYAAIIQDCKYVSQSAFYWIPVRKRSADLPRTLIVLAFIGNLQPALFKKIGHSRYVCLDIDNEGGFKILGFQTLFFYRHN